jgi:hypothetical protein
MTQMTKKIIFFALLTYLCLAQNVMLRDMVSADMMEKMDMDMTIERIETMAIKNTDNFDMTDIEMMPR